MTVTGQGSAIPVAWAQVGKDSSFDTGPVPSGKYKVRAVEMGSEVGISGSKDIVLDSSDVTGVTISLNPARKKQVDGVIRAEGESKLDYSKLSVVLMSDVEAGDLTEARRGGDIRPDVWGRLC